jgi:predicted ATP-binding protein involved in virulence
MQSETGGSFEYSNSYSPSAISNYINDLVQSCVDSQLFHYDVGNFLRDHISYVLLRRDSINEPNVRLAISDNLKNKGRAFFEASLRELDTLFAENESKSGGEFYTPQDVNLLVAQLGAEYEPNSVCDPFAGAGSTAFLFDNALGTYFHIDTQEVNRDAHFQIVISRVVKDVYGKDFLGDSLSMPHYQEEQYDLVVSFPPFGMKIPKSNRRQILERRRNYWLEQANNLPESRSDWFVTLSMLPALNTRGKLITGMSLASMSRSGAETKIRRFLVDQGNIEKVILLPKNIYYSTSISSVLVVLNNESDRGKRRDIQFVDASLFYQPSRGRNSLSPDNIEKILASCLSDGRFSKTVSSEKVVNNDFNLNPSLYVEKTVKVNQVTLTNFRGYTDFTIPIHESLTVLVGENGAGKTSILEAISCGLGPFLTAMPEAKGKLIRKSDVHVGPNGVAGFARISIDTNSSLSWDLVTKGSERNNLAKIGTQALSDFANEIVSGDEEYPLIAYYGTSRALSSSSGKVSISPFEVVQRSEGYDSALDAKINYGSLKNWFSKIEVDELNLRDQNKNHSYVHPAKALVTNAVKQMVQRAENVVFDKVTNDVVVSWINEDKEIISLGLEQLSEGYRNMVALTIDLVRRAFLLNPHSKSPLHVSGVVLIDEIELHLHPRWQQMILKDLTTLFPKIQFVVTTHSPQVLTTVKGECIRVVSNSSREAEFVSSPYGGESSRVMQQILHVNPRPDTDVNRKLKKYFELIEIGEGEEQQAITLRQELTHLTDGTEPMLAEADLAIKRVNWMKSRKKK